MASPLLGKWKLEKSEMFDEYMKAVGVNIALRKVGAITSSTSEITDEGNGKIRINTQSTFKSANVVFNVGEEIEEHTMDGRTCRTTMDWEGNEKLHQVQHWGKDRTATLDWTFQNGEMILQRELKKKYIENRVAKFIKKFLKNMRGRGTQPPKIEFPQFPKLFQPKLANATVHERETNKAINRDSLGYFWSYKREKMSLKLEKNENIYETITRRVSKLDKVAQIAAHHVGQLRTGTVRKAASSPCIANISDNFQTTLNDVTVVGLHKRNIPKKSYYFIILVTWKDGSHVTLYRKSKEIKAFHETLIQEISSCPVHSEAIRFLTKLNPRTPFRIVTSLMGTNRRLRMMDKINRYFQAMTYYFNDVSHLKAMKDFFHLSKYDVNIEKFCKVGKTYFCVSKSMINRRDVIIKSHVQKQNSEEGLDELCKEKRISMTSSNDGVDSIYEATDDYIPTEADQNQNIIKLHAHEKVEVICKSKTGWWFVRRIKENEKDSSGYVPASFLKNISSTDDKTLNSSTDEDKQFYFVAKESYSSQKSDELSFQEGDILRIVQKYDDGWWMARKDNDEGLVPAVRLHSRGIDPIMRMSSAIFATSE